MNWQTSITNIKSLGSQSNRPGSLAGLHEARKKHLSQFFTPKSIADYAWQLVEPALNRSYDRGEGNYRVSLFDNSIGTGRLFANATPDKHHLSGVDVHLETLNALINAADQANFKRDFVCAGMETISIQNYGVGLINPPYSIHLESPFLDKFPSTHFGLFGPDTSAISHYYALDQALSACDIVCAVVPRTMAESLINDPVYSYRLVAAHHLPAQAFIEENTKVSTSIILFGSNIHDTEIGNVDIVNVGDISTVPKDYNLECRNTFELPVYDIKVQGVEDSQAVILTPVTGDRDVKLAHNGRKIILKFKCGLVEAKVRNALLKESVKRYVSKGHRYPVHMKFTGQGILDIETHLLQADPYESLNNLCDQITQAGGLPDKDASFTNYFHKRIKQSRIEKTPLRHTVRTISKASTGDTVIAISRLTHVTDADVWGSPVINQGDELEFTVKQLSNGRSFTSVINKTTYCLTDDKFHEIFEIKQEIHATTTDHWETVHPGLLETFPNHANALKQKANALGINNILTWDFQFDDLLEFCMSPTGAICSWSMGLGKARLAISLALMGGKHNLLVLESYLVREMIEELQTLNIDTALWQQITSISQLSDLRKINIISYTRLRMPLNSANKRITYAKALRRRIHSIVCDEGELLSNQISKQSRACRDVSAKKFYILSGTPIGNYPRDVLPLINCAGGDGTAAQTYGVFNAKLEKDHIQSTAYAQRGLDAFREMFVELEWCTNEFKDDLRSGAKREIPKIKNVPAFRSVIAPFIKRRIHAEPEVNRYVKLPGYEKIITRCSWDDGHLSYYLQVAEDFSSWYTDQKKKTLGTQKSLNLVALLARIQAVELASNVPHKSIAGFPYSHKTLTSKQRKAIERLTALTQEGHKTILYARNPDSLERLSKELADIGIEHVVIHGKIPEEKRYKDINRFRYENIPVMLATLGVSQKGLNLWQADRVIMYGRSWGAKDESQAIARLLRPQQIHRVIVEYLHMEGSIDEYQHQMVKFKQETHDVGLDWGSPSLDDVEFLHLDTILGRFIDDIAKLKGCKPHEIRERLAA